MIYDGLHSGHMFPIEETPDVRCPPTYEEYGGVSLGPAKLVCAELNESPVKVWGDVGGMVIVAIGGSVRSSVCKGDLNVVCFASILGSRAYSHLLVPDALQAPKHVVDFALEAAKVVTENNVPDETTWERRSLRGIQDLITAQLIVMHSLVIFYKMKVTLPLFLEGQEDGDCDCADKMREAIASIPVISDNDHARLVLLFERIRTGPPYTRKDVIDYFSPWLNKR